MLTQGILGEQLRPGCVRTVLPRLADQESGAYPFRRAGEPLDASLTAGEHNIVITCPEMRIHRSRGGALFPVVNSSSEGMPAIRRLRRASRSLAADLP